MIFRNNYQVMDKNIQIIQQMAERISGRSKLVKSEIHATVQKHVIALEQREQELIGKVEQIRQVWMVATLIVKAYRCTLIYPNKTCEMGTVLGQLLSDEVLARILNRQWKKCQYEIQCCLV